MEIYQQIQNQAEIILGELRADGLNLSITDTGKLHIVGPSKPAQLALIRLWKQGIIDALSPKCTDCTLPMQIIDDGKLWFCALGCSSKKIQSKDLQPEFTAREIYGKHWSKLSKPKDVQNGLDILVEYGYLSSVTINEGHRPKTVYLIHGSLR
jgi:hypothetical protein